MQFNISRFLEIVIYLTFLAFLFVLGYNSGISM